MSHETPQSCPRCGSNDKELYLPKCQDEYWNGDAHPWHTAPVPAEPSRCQECGLPGDDRFHGVSNHVFRPAAEPPRCLCGDIGINMRCPIHWPAHWPAAAPAGTPRHSITQPITYPGTLSSCCNAPVVEHDDMCCTKCGHPCAPTGTGEGSELIVTIARELYDRFVMGGWEPQDAYPQIREWLRASRNPNPELAVEFYGANVRARDAQDTAAALRWQLDDAEAVELQLAKQFEDASDRAETAERDLATAQARIAQLEQHLNTALAVAANVQAFDLDELRDEWRSALAEAQPGGEKRQV